jgi:thioredoxin reductase
MVLLLQPSPLVLDVVIIGGGPAGLSAALVLGRCRRKVLLCDAGEPRNARARGLHGYLTRDGLPPLELLRLGREELRPYGIEVRSTTVTGVARSPVGFDVTLAGGEAVQSRTVLIATGVRDRLPDIPGVEECYGTSIHHCPYCDGWESRDTTLAVIGQGAGGTALSLSLKTWSDHVILCSNGPARLRPVHRAQLEQHSIEIVESRISRLDHEDGRVRELVMASGQRVACGAIFFSTGQRPQCELPRQLGCALNRQGLVKTDRLGRTGVPGLYVAGDASRDVQFVVVAAAEGAKAAVAINKALQAESGQAAAS